MLTTKADVSTVFDGEDFTIGSSQGTLMNFGSEDAALIRDMESVAPEVSRLCWPGLDGREDQPSLQIAWGGGEGRRLPVLRGALTRVFPDGILPEPRTCPRAKGKQQRWNQIRDLLRPCPHGTDRVIHPLLD